jgi:hypothetical protein
LTDNSTRLSILPILFIQAVLTIVVFWYVQPFIIDWSFFGFERVFYENKIYGSDILIRVAGFDLTYIFSAPASELREFYPSFYWAVYMVGLGLRYGVPLAAALCLLKWIRTKNRFGRFLLDFGDFRIGRFIVLSLLVQLGFYFFVAKYNSQPVEFQIRLARIFLGMNMLTIGLYAFQKRHELYEKFKRFLFEPALPYTLAITRILFFSYATFLYLILFRVGHGSNLGVLDKVALPGIGWLIEVIPVNSQIYTWFCFAGAFVSFMIVIGYKTRLFLVLNTIIIFYVVAAPNFFGKLWHEQLIIWISWIIAFSPCADVLSVDSLRKPKSKALADPKYGVHLKLIWLHFGHIYFFAGFYKLWVGGFDWALSDSIIHLVQIEWFENFDTASSWRVDKIPVLLKVGGLSVILFELFYAILLFGKKTKWISILGGLAMHNFIGQVMYISFFALLQVFYVVFIPWNWILTKVGVVSENFKENFERPRLNSLPVVIPLIILGMNLLYGVFRIDSYPFSVYPVYCDILPENIKYFDYRVADVDLTHLKFREEGKKVNFRWEDYSRQEYYIIEKVGNGQPIDSVGVKLMWKRWQLGVPALQGIDSVDIYVVERPLNPERSTEIISETFLMSLYSNNRDK